jgi:pseudouridine-5'-monophosphatase
MKQEAGKIANVSDLPVKAVSFDAEGLILDSELPKRVAFVRVVREMFGKELELTDFLWTLGLKKDQVVEGLSQRFKDAVPLPGIKIDPDRSIGEQILERRNALVPVCETKAMSGIKEILGDLRELRVPMAIASSTAEAVLHEMFEAAGIQLEWFDQLVAGDDPEVKANPDRSKKPIFQVAARRLGVPINQTLVVGDAAADVDGAINAGAPVLFVPDKRLYLDGPPPEIAKRATFTARDLFKARVLLIERLQHNERSAAQK